jgi:hypothetical protein
VEERTELVERKSADVKTEEKFGGGLMAGNSDRRLGGSRDKAGRLMLCHGGLSEEALSGRKGVECGQTSG